MGVLFGIDEPQSRRVQTAGNSNYSGLGNVAGNLEVWDQVPYLQEMQFTEPGGTIDSTSWGFSSWFGTPAWKAENASPTWMPFQAYGAFGNIVPCTSDCDPHVGSDSAGNS